MDAPRSTRSTCAYCGVGCGVIVDSRGDRIVGVRGDPDHPANRGRLCSKGSTLHLTAAAPVLEQGRLLRPLRRPQRGGATQPVGWDDALDLVADKLAATIGAHGPDAVGLYLSGQLLTEDYHAFNKLGRALIGTHNVDTNSRLCMSSAVAGYKATLGADAPPACYDDLAHARTVFIAGSNAAWAHPVLFRRLEDARAANPGQRWIVVDPRRTETAAAADLHLQLLPGTDVALYHGMLHLMLWEGLVDTSYIAQHTSGFAALRDRVREHTPRQVASLCGLKEDDVVQAARWFAGLDDGSRTPTLSLYCQGLNQSRNGTDNNAALIGLHLATGQIGRAGAGPLSLTGQPNAMGGREVGALANLLPGHREVANAAHRAEVEALWGLKPGALPARPGKTAVELFEAAADGAIKLLWIACTDPAFSLPDQATVRRALQRCDFVVLQDAFAQTATAPFADLLLPASTWGEKDGTVTNSERCISRVRAAVAPPGLARADRTIAVDVARRLERRLPPRRVDGATLFPHDDAESLWNEHREATRGRDLDIGGLSYALLDQAPRQWPFPDDADAGRARLYVSGRFATDDGRARFAAPAYRGVAEPRDARHPVSLTSGRLRDQWHGMSRSGTLGRLFGHAPQPALQMHPQELARRHWAPGTLVRVRSRRGEIVLPVQPDDGVAPAQAFVAMHWGDTVVSGHDAAGAALAGVNALFPSVACPVSRQPELKHAAVRVDAAVLPWRLAASAWLAPADALRARRRLQDWLPRFGYASCVPFGREPDGRVGVRFDAAAAEPAPAAWLAGIAAELQLDRAGALQYDDARRGQHRRMMLGADGTLDGFLLAGDVAAAPWVLELLQSAAPARPFGAALLAGRATPPQPMAARGAQVCTCFGVDEPALRATLRRHGGDEAQRLQALQRELRCGTNCGSCLPALRTLVRQTPCAAALRDLDVPAAAPARAAASRS